MKKLFILIIICTLLVGCWNNQEVDNSLFVLGVGINKEDDRLIFSTESIKPSSEGVGTPSEDQTDENIILQIESKSFMHAARQLIRYAKRRLYFTHTRTWVIGEEFAKEEFVEQLDIMRRNEMLRLNSYLFITPGDPSDILKTPSIYNDLSSLEIISAIDQTEYNSEYPVIDLREFFRLLEGETRNAHLPIIMVRDMQGNKVTSLEGAAIIKENRMVGKLSIQETAGLNILLNKAKGGSLTVSLSDHNESSWASINIKDCVVTMEPKIEGNQVKANIQVEVEGLLGEYVTSDDMTAHFIKDIEKRAEKLTEQMIRGTLNKLQHDLKTDATRLGIIVHRKFPKKWQRLKENWDEHFSKAEITIQVNHHIKDPGLLKKNVDKEKDKSEGNLYPTF